MEERTVSGAFDLPGGVPVSLTKDTGQQWDFPNAWPPLVHAIILGFRFESAHAHQTQRPSPRSGLER